jgi:hypothetical protein
MTDPMGTERYCVCPTCRSRFAFPSSATDKTFILRSLDGETRGLCVRGVAYCGNCGTAFMPDLAGYIREHETEIAGEVEYVGDAGDARPRWLRDVPASDVVCRVSGRRLRFHPDSAKFEDGEYITVDVMTDIETDSGTRRRKLCELIVTREDLVRALDTVQVRMSRRD